MTHIIVKDGRVAVSGGRVVTSAGGAPCCCGGGGTCYIIVLACGCDDLSQARYTPVGSAIDLAWPYADRLAGKAISVDGICYRYIGSTTTIPPFADLLSGAPGTVYDSCDDSPCSDQAVCPPCPGGFVASLAKGIGFPIQFFWECVQDFRVECIATMEVIYSATASETFTTSNNGQVSDEHSVQIAVDFTATFIGASNAPTYTVTESSSGFARSYNTSGGLTNEDVWDYQDTRTSGLSTSNMYFDSVAQSLLPGVRVYGASGSDITNSVGFQVPSNTNALLQVPFECNGSFSQDAPSDDGACTTTQNSTSSVSHSPAASGLNVTSRRYDCDADFFTDLEWSNTRQITRRITLVDGTVIELVQCDGPGGGGSGGGGPVDIGDPQPEPDDPAINEGVPGLGDFVAEAIRMFTLDTVKSCAGCERRKQVLNRFGERVGRAVIRRLGW